MLENVASVLHILVQTLEENFRIEWFDQVVHDASRHSGAHGLQFPRCRDGDNIHRVARQIACCPENIDPRHIRQVDVQKHQDRAERGDEGQTFSAGVGNANDVKPAVSEQKAGMDAGHFLVIVNDHGADKSHETKISLSATDGCARLSRTVNSAPPRADFSAVT